MTPNYSLGISLGHDSGVALICDDEILFAANEERFSRIKGHSGLPLKSLEYILTNFDIITSPLENGGIFRILTDCFWTFWSSYSIAKNHGASVVEGCYGISGCGHNVCLPFALFA